MAPTGFSIERFLNIRSAYGPSFSPDGRDVAFLSNTTGVFQLWQVPGDGSIPMQLTFTPETVYGTWYSPRRSELIFGMDAGGNERAQLYRLFSTGEGAGRGLGDGWDWTDLTRHPEAVHFFGGWNHDGQQFAFSANRTQESRFDIYVQTLDGEARLLKEGPGGYYGPVNWSPDDRWLLVMREESGFNQDLYLLAVDSGSVRHLTPHQGDARYESPRWSADGTSVYCVTTHAAGTWPPWPGSMLPPAN